VKGPVPDLSQLTEALNSKAQPQQEVALVVDRSRQDIGKLVRLNQLQRRMNLIQNYIGDWKPVSNRIE